jgi:hypothetical protein
LLLLPSSHQIHITHVILIPTDKQLETVEAWLVEHGIEPDQAASATSSYFTTFNVASRPALARPGLFTELVEEQVRNAFGLWFSLPNSCTPKGSPVIQVSFTKTGSGRSDDRKEQWLQTVGRFVSHRHPVVRKRHFLRCHFILKMHHFTKTGSGQT